MKIVSQLTQSRHGGIVFINSEAASRRDMTLAIAIMSEDQSEIAILGCEAPEVQKIKALLDAGFKPSYAKLPSGNYFVCQQSAAKSITESEVEVFDADSMNEANVSTDLPNNSVTDPAPGLANKRPVIYKRKVIGLYNEATDELEIDDEYHVEDHDYLLLEPCDDMPYWEIEDGSLDSIMAMKDKTVKEPARVTEACEMAIAASQFLNY
ncbi:hypothetical protein MM182_18870 [Aeromonas sp. MR19]|uniref:hypothetical protein n=1 Tax=Aeromonas sp. MR19 TaxID=2923421 RepID=UPI001F4A2157|nr:hypothetical protein [Aeromonas sp. MR19]MCH7377418.1 hypothetical protein [Aeromonas sp. MR19]